MGIKSYSVDIDDVCALFGYFSERNEYDNKNITHLKLQKLLYFAQGLCLGKYGEKLYDEKIEAWRHGPVCPTVYQKFKHKSYYDIKLSEFSGNFNNIKVGSEAYIVVEKVWEFLGGLSGPQLESITYQETPWQEAIMKGFNIEIPEEDICNFFQKVSMSIWE